MYFWVNSTDFTFWCELCSNTAFTYGDLDKAIYMRQLKEYYQGGLNVICRLHKLLYSLKQLASQWNKKLYIVVDTLGFKCVWNTVIDYLYKKAMELLHVLQEEFDYFLHTYCNVGWDKISYFEYWVYYGHHHIKPCKLW